MTEQLVGMIQSGAIDVAPAYQRQFRWNNERRSQLIESLMLGIPVPSLFMATNKDATWELVDGVQRLSSVVQFMGSPDTRTMLKIDSALKLEGLKKLTDFNGLTFDELPKSIQLHFSHRPLKIIALTDKSDEVVRFDLFERLNNGGVVLTNQEIRACVYRGRFNTFLEECAKNEDFNSVVRFNKGQLTDGSKEEYELRFFAFLHQYNKFDHSVVEFLNDYMSVANKKFNYRTEGTLFENTFRQLRKALPNGIVRTATRQITPVNLFEAVSVGAALALKKRRSLVSKSNCRWLGSKEINNLTTAATNNRRMVIERIEKARDKFFGK